jgi:hypothetical protein
MFYLLLAVPVVLVDELAQWPKRRPGLLRLPLLISGREIAKLLDMRGII